MKGFATCTSLLATGSLVRKPVSTLFGLDGAEPTAPYAALERLNKLLGLNPLTRTDQTFLRDGVY